MNDKQPDVTIKAKTPEAAAALQATMKRWEEDKQKADKTPTPKGFIEVFDTEEKVDVLINVNTIVRVKPYNGNTLLWLNMHHPNALGYTVATSISYDKVKALIAEAQ